MLRQVGQLVASLDPRRPVGEAGEEAGPELAVGVGVGQPQRQPQSAAGGASQLHAEARLEPLEPGLAAVELLPGAAAAARGGVGAQQVVVVVGEEHQLGVEVAAIEPPAELVVDALLGGHLLRGARRGGREAAVHPQEEDRGGAQPVADAQTGDHLGEVVAPHGERRAGAKGVGGAEVAAGQLDRLDPHARRPGPPAAGEGVLDEEGQGAGVGDPVGLAAGCAEALEDPAPALHPVEVLLLEAVLAVLVRPHSDRQLVPPPPAEIEPGDDLEALGVVVAAIVPHREGAGGAVRFAPQHRQPSGVEIGSGQYGGHAHAAHRLQLVPVAEEVVAVEGGRQVERARRVHVPAQLELLVVGDDAVPRRGGVAAVGIALEVALGEAQVGLVALLPRLAQLQLECLEEGGAGAAGETQLAQVVLQLEAGGPPAVEPFEAVGRELVGLEQPADARARVAHRGVGAAQLVVARGELHAGPERTRNAGGEIVDGAAVGIGTLADRARALADLETLHAAGGGRVVGGGRGVGGRSHQHAVLQQGDLLAALDAGAADPDVGPQTVAVLLLDRDPGSAAQHAVDVGVLLSLELAAPDDVRRSGHAERLRLRADHQELLEEPRALALLRPLPGLRRLRRALRLRCPHRRGAADQSQQTERRQGVAAEEAEEAHDRGPGKRKAGGGLRADVRPPEPRPP